LGTPNASACGGAVTITNNAPPNLTFPAGTNLVTWTFYDTNGNYSTCLQQVIVLGSTTPPLIACPNDVTVNAAAGSCFVPRSQVFLDVPSVIDCLPYSATNNAPANFPVGTNIVIWAVTNSAGNGSTCQQRVIVKDSQAPTIACPANITVNTGPVNAPAT
jgi:hypothetical protein